VPPYASQPYGARAASSPNPVCITSLVCGILGVLGSVGCLLFGIPLGVVALVTGIIGLSQAREQSGEGKAMAIGGMCCGAVAIVLSLALFLLPFGFGRY